MIRPDKLAQLIEERRIVKTKLCEELEISVMTLNNFLNKGSEIGSNKLEKIADIVIIDTGAGINPSVMEFLISSPETILVTTPEPTSVTDSYALLKALSMTEGFQGKNTTVKMIANRVSDAGEGKNLYEKLSMVVSKFLNINIEFLGVIPQDSYITKAIMKQKPVSIMYPNAAASKQFEAIAKKLSGTQQDVPDSRRGIRGYFKNFFAKKNV